MGSIPTSRILWLATTFTEPLFAPLPPTFPRALVAVLYHVNKTRLPRPAWRGRAVRILLVIAYARLPVCSTPFKIRVRPSVCVSCCTDSNKSDIMESDALSCIDVGISKDSHGPLCECLERRLSVRSLQRNSIDITRTVHCFCVFRRGMWRSWVWHTWRHTEMELREWVCVCACGWVGVGGCVWVGGGVCGWVWVCVCGCFGVWWVGGWVCVGVGVCVCVVLACSAGGHCKPAGFIRRRGISWRAEQLRASQWRLCCVKLCVCFWGQNATLLNCICLLQHWTPILNWMALYWLGVDVSKDSSGSVTQRHRHLWLDTIKCTD
jgi:hypothetical protein